MDVSVIIVSWNVATYLAACLRSLKAGRGGLNMEVIVVDSASTDDTVARVQREFPWVRLLPQTENVGFTRGNNLGLATASGRTLLLLNPDTEVAPTMLARLVGYLDAHPDVGIVGPHTLNPDGSTQSSRRRFPTLATALFESTWLQPYAPRGVLARYRVEDAPDDATLDVDWVQGHALLARRAVYEQIGGLDDGFVMYSEELDWCRRAKAAGWRVAYVGDAQVTHHGGQSTAQAGYRQHVHFQASKVRYFRKHHGPIAAALLRAFLLTSYGLQLLLEAAKGALGHKRALRRERVGLYWRVLRSGLHETA